LIINELQPYMLSIDETCVNFTEHIFPILFKKPNQFCERKLVEIKGLSMKFRALNEPKPYTYFAK